MLVYRRYSVHVQVMNWKISVSKIMCCWLGDLVRFPSESYFTITSRQPWALSGFFPVESRALPQGCFKPRSEGDRVPIVTKAWTFTVIPPTRNSPFMGKSKNSLFLDCLTLKIEGLHSETLVIFYQPTRGYTSHKT